MILHTLIQIEQALRFHSAGDYEANELQGIAISREQGEGIITLIVNRLVFNLHATRYQESYLMDMHEDPSGNLIYNEICQQFNEAVVRIHQECRDLPYPLAMSRQELILFEVETELTDFIWTVYQK